MTLLELTAAFAPSPTRLQVKPLFIRKVVDSQGIVLLENEPQKGQVLDPAVAFLVTDMLKDVLTEGGTAGGASSILNRPAAGKSGTSQGSKNAHMVGYTPQLLAGIYIGDDFEKPIEFSGEVMPPPCGPGSWSAPKDAPVLDFKIPDGITSRTLCPVSGLPLALTAPNRAGPNI